MYHSFYGENCEPAAVEIERENLSKEDEGRNDNLDMACLGKAGYGWERGKLN